jgi:hypothetical protein
MMSMDIIRPLCPILFAAFVTACALVSPPPEATPEPRSYLALPVDSLGMLPSLPYVWEDSAGIKHLAVVGTLHTRDPRAPMYIEIERVFERLRPDLVLHESRGPERADTLRDRAIERGGGIGHAHYLANRQGAVIQSGDAPERAEFAALLERYPAEEVLVFLTSQRLLGGYDPDSAAVAQAYPRFFTGYLHEYGLPFRDGWDTWSGFLRTYARVMGRPLTASSWDPDWVSPIRDAGRLSEIARASTEFRDEWLLNAIRQELQDHDRVLVIFGGWHVVALEPVLGSVLRQAGGCADEQPRSMAGEG